MITISTSAAIIASSMFCAAILWAGATDLFTMKIRNHTVLFLLAVYALLAPLSGLSLAEIGSSVGLAAGVLACLIIFFSFGWIGGGDAKLAAAVVLWLGTEHTLPFVAYTGLLGGALTVAILMFRSTLLPVFCIGVPWIDRLHARNSGVPYGLAISAAALLTFSQTHWFAWLN